MFFRILLYRKKHSKTNIPAALLSIYLYTDDGQEPVRFEQWTTLLSENFSLSLGGGAYQINDDKWVPVGLDGNEASNAEFGMNFGINLMLNDNLGILMKYNLIEPKEESVESMSLNGLSFGLIIR